jgi:hypothetical protein
VRRRSQAIEGFGAIFNSDIELFVRTYVASLRATRCDGKVQAVIRAMRFVRNGAAWSIWTFGFFALGCSAQIWAANSSSRSRK